MIQITHVIPGLGKGGAETMLCNLFKYQSDPEIKHSVISLGLSSYYENSICDMGIPLCVLDMRKRPLASLWKLRKILKKSQYISCWLYVACAICFIITNQRQHERMIWNIRHASLDEKHNSKITLWAARYCQKHSGAVSAVLYNGQTAMEIHKQTGYHEKRSHVVENGCDTQIYKKDPEARYAINAKYEFQNKKIILSVGRYHPIKDYPMIVHAMAELVKVRNDVVLVLCGRGLTEDNEELMKLIDDSGLQPGKNAYLLGQQEHIEIWMSAADVYVLHSTSEAFPNTLLEAMACECVCVSTDVGTAGELIEKDKIVEIQNYQQCCDVIEQVLNLSEEKRELAGKRNRKKVVEGYSIQNVVRRYETIYYELAKEMNIKRMG